MASDIEARIDAALARIDAQVEGARSARTTLDAAMEDLRSVRVSVRSAGSECEVTASAEGAVLGIKFARDIRLSAGFESLLVDTIARAQAEARERAADKAALLIGESSPLVAQLRTTTGKEDTP